MPRRIDADELAKEIESMSVAIAGRDIFPQEAKDCVLAHIHDAPTIDAVPVVRGQWVTDNAGNLWCSECKHTGCPSGCKDTDCGKALYCHSCGARMDAEEAPYAL